MGNAEVQKYVGGSVRLHDLAVGIVLIGEVETVEYNGTNRVAFTVRNASQKIGRLAWQPAVALDWELHCIDLKVQKLARDRIQFTSRVVADEIEFRLPGDERFADAHAEQ